MDALARFADLLARPAPALPLDEAALCIAAVAQPDLDIDESLGRLDVLATESHATDVATLMQFLFASGRYRGNSDDYYDPRNSYLDQVVARGQGIPITLSVLAIEVGRRVGVPLVGVGMPGHFLVRDWKNPEVYVDTFNAGHLLHPGDCQQLFRRTMGRQAPWHDAYLTPVSPVAIVERMVANLRLTFQRNGDQRGQRWVMRLRVRCPAATAADHDDLARLLADTN